jgi:predicted Zn-dependent protease
VIRCFASQRWLSAALPCLVLTACTINPVTGERQVSIISAAEELAIGAAQYAPSRQMQGGDYVVDPRLADYVAEVGNRLAAVSDRDLPYEFAVLNNSVPNAWALPGGKIAVNRGLLVELESEAELAAVLGHEIVHAAARHGAQAMQRGLLLQGAVLATAAASRGNYSNLAVGAASLGAQLINQRYSRGAELESDEYGMIYMSRAGYDPAAAVSLQETFVRLAGGRADAGWLEGLFASHPPSTERVERNRATRTTLPPGGEIGRDPYRAAIQTLLESRPAYDAYDRGRAALGDGRLADARAAADEAIRLFPREAHFHALLGDIALAEDRPQTAADHYRDALSRNDQYFYYPLRLGTALLRQDRMQAAEAQYEASIALLPTADAHYGLGQISEQRGEIASALEHYRQAAGSSSPVGEASRDAIVRLDLPGNPGAYLQVDAGLDAQGRLFVDVGNPTRFAVTDIELAIRYVEDSGAIASTRRTVTSVLQPNSAQRFTTGLGPFPSGRGFDVALDAARLLDP